MSRTIAKAIQKLDGEVEVENFFAWLKTMMLNLRTDEMRRAVVRGTQPVESEQLESYVGADWSTDEQILKDSDSEAIRQAIAELDPKYRQAMLMRYYDDFSFKEIAQILNLPMGTVSRRIQIAHHLLASKLGAKLGRKPIALLAAALLGIGTLFGAWQAGLGEWVEELISSPQSEATQIEAVQSEATQPEGTRHSCRVSQDESTASTTTNLTTKEEPPMNRIKGTLLAAATAVSLMSTAQVDEPIPVTPETMESSGAGTVKKVDGDYVLSFTDTAHTYSFTIPDGVESIRYLVVAGGGAGGAGSGSSGGGGGAGGMLESLSCPVSAGDTLLINVGTGGAEVFGDNAGNPGKDSSITNGVTEMVRTFGGGGGGSKSHEPTAGGSGGGSNGMQVSQRKGAPSLDETGAQGNAGGGESGKQLVAAGGGGAGEAGKNASSSTNCSGGAGGDGRMSDITGKEIYYAGGGGGGGRGTGGRSSGGEGGGGQGGGTDSSGGANKNGLNGEDGKGGGGGGMFTATESGLHSGKGGDGVVIIRYLAPAAAKATVHFLHESNTATWVATAFGEEIEEGSEVDDGTTITVVATLKDGYEYLSAPEGWAENADGDITADFVAKAPECTIQIPAATAIPFTMNFTPGANASYTATVDGQPVQNGAKIRTGKQIVVVVTPNTDCEYAAIPDGWETGEVEGTLTRTITAGEGVPQLTIPDATAIDYVPVQFTSNGSAFFEATNAVGEAVAGRVRAGTEVFVKIWAGVGFVYNETPTGWTWEAEDDAYTRAFTAVSGSTLTIQIPNAREIGGKWTKTIDEHDGYMFETNKDLVVVFTNVTKTHTMILPSGVTSLRYLVVGGGGSGGGYGGGGGGAGGFLTGSEYKVVGRTLEIKVGQGGARITDSAAGKIGDDSYIKNGSAEMRAYGGGGGGSSPNMSSAGLEATSGGSGGGANGRTGYAQQGFGICPGANPKDDKQGFKGGGGDDWVYGKQYSASGGGGAGGPGGTCVDNNTGAAGGVGRECNITETPIYYAGGGGGASYSSGAAALGGNGGGGAGGYNGDNNGQDGTDGLGGGGGGRYKTGNNEHSGKGGDGVVILRFKKPSNGIVIFIM